MVILLGVALPKCGCFLGAPLIPAHVVPGLNDAAHSVPGGAVAVPPAPARGDAGPAIFFRRECGHLTHAFMEPEAKEAAKAALGFAAVPFYVVADGTTGRVALSGGGKACTLEAIRAALEAAVPEDREGGATTGAPIDVTAEELHLHSEFTLDEDF